MKAKTLSVILTCVNFVLIQGYGLSVSHGNSTADTGRRILTGEDANPADFLFMVRLHRRGSAGGSIINEYWILTCAHCLFEIECPRIEIFPSTYVRGDAPSIHPIACYINDKWGSQAMYAYDVCLIRTQENLVEDLQLQIIPLPAPNMEFPPGTKVVIAGWGQTETNKPSSKMLRADMEIVDWNFCNTKFKDTQHCLTETDCHYKDIPLHSICIDGPNFVGACLGDSGSPIIADGVVAGIVVGIYRYYHQCVVGYPSMGMNVVDFLQWISGIMEEEKAVDTLISIYENL